MGLDNINDRPAQPDPHIDRELAPGAEDKVETENQTSFENARSHMEEMLQMNFGVINELLGQIVAVNPFRLDMVQGKQPELAAIDASNEPKGTPVAPVGKASASAYISGLQHINDALTTHNAQVQQAFDALALSRSGRKPDLFNHGVEYEKLMTMVNQAQSRLHQLGNLLPETLPENTGSNLNELMPEFSEKLVQYDGSFQYLQVAVNANLQEAMKAAKQRR